MKVLLAGDGFVTPDVLGAAISAALPEAETAALQFGWPVEPQTDFGGVKEATGDEDELIAALQGASVCFTHTGPITDKVMAASPDLKLVTVCRGGPVNADIAAATRRGIMVTNTPGRNATATTEHTIAMILAAVRQLVPRHIELIADEWHGDYYEYEKVGPEVRGSTVGVIGYGAVGSRVAAAMQALGATVLVYDPWVDPSRVAPGVELVPALDALLSRSTIVTIHARVTPENHHMIAAPQIALMPRGSILVNCARGSLLDYDAACDALDSGHLFAASFDCLPSEPLPPGHRLTRTPRLTLTPHLGGASKQAAELAARIGADDIARFAHGEAPVHLMNPEVLKG
ncbi:2-hydroxyacid dehydrogenase [Propionicicella superfundia]|uniref:2-hydroxyacid dehydrogenase n=1 Tax=Propionicicella superfundia TaxID=348582 RepID=UPI0004268F25|nr:2-hydroxyacid dehydrogenase [Propionicicella superfundia]